MDAVDMKRCRLGPSFETPACGGLLRMMAFFAAKSETLMVRSVAFCDASRTMRPHIAIRIIRETNL
jgi:hypothetical protein